MTAAAPGSPSTDRRRLARSFGQAADSYDRFRPDYPSAAVTAAVDSAQRVLDLGAGTGKLTRLLPAAGAQQVWAVEPDLQMRGVLTATSPNTTVLPGSAERIPLQDAAVDVVVVGQACTGSISTARCRRSPGCCGPEGAWCVCGTPPTDAMNSPEIGCAR